MLGVHFDDRNVGLRVSANDFGVELGFVVRQGDFDFIRAIHDVVVGEDVAVFADDDSRAEGLFAPLAGDVFKRHAEELPEERVVEQRRQGRIFPHRFCRVDVHHTGRDFFHDRREAGRLRLVAVDGGVLNVKPGRRRGVSPRREPTGNRGGTQHGGHGEMKEAKVCFHKFHSVC